MAKKFTREEKKRLIEICDVFKWLHWHQILALMLWEVFTPTKVDVFFEWLDNGLSVGRAYNKAFKA